MYFIASLILFLTLAVSSKAQGQRPDCSNPVITSVSFERSFPFQPAQPESGADFYAYFRATVPYSAPTQVPGNDDFKISPTGQINSIQPPSDCTEAECQSWILDGYVELNNFWSASETTLEIEVDKCKTSTVIDHPPLCYPYGAYQPHCGSVGPVTDKAAADIVIACTEAMDGYCFPSLEDCVNVKGPSNFTVTTAQDIEPSNFAYTQLGVSWKEYDPQYLGKVTIEVNCDLKDAAGQSQIRPILPYTLTRIPFSNIANPVYKVSTSNVHPFELEFETMMSGVSQPRESSAK